MKSIQIIEPAGTAHQASLIKNVAQLTDAGFDCLYSPLKVESKWPYTSASKEARLAQLSEALRGTCDIVMAARGGYGVSDLLPHLDWTALKKVNPKTIVGFSDITALQNALYLKLGWQGLHAPMIGSTLWGLHREDIDLLISFLKNGQPWENTVQVDLLAGKNQSLTGHMFGGCFAVLTNLLATPFFELSAKENVLFLEDINEHPARLLRFWNQWVQTGNTRFLKAVVLGRLTDLSEEKEYSDTKARLAEQMNLASEIPIYSYEGFGHCSPNIPVGIGAEVNLDAKGKLQWVIR